MTVPVTPSVFNALQSDLAANGSALGAVSTEPPQPLSAPLIRMSISEDTPIPSSLVMALDAAYLFHLLARDPGRVVPPGKSLLSVLVGLKQTVTRTLDSPPEKSVQKTVHRAFWDQALEALSSPLPSSQVGRLKALYKDLHETLTPLFPPTHPALAVFSLPLPPTTSPLLTAVTHLRDALIILRQRCAPIRDDTIDGLLHRIDHRSPSASTDELAGLLVDVIRSMFELSFNMRDDYSNAVLATASEKELAGMVATTAETQEQGLVLRLWESKEAMREAWARWMDGFLPADPTLQPRLKQFWILKLIQSLGKPHAVASKLVGPPPPRETVDDSKVNRDPDPRPERTPEPPNILPPQFLFSGPALFHLQNYIQALTIAASLRSLVPVPRPSTNLTPPPYPQMSDFIPPTSWGFTERVWALLEPEIRAAGDGPSETKMINFADEVVMTYTNVLPPGVNTLDPQLEKRLRSTVDRILRTDDPVFILLRDRLLTALSIALLDNPVAEEPPVVRMQSGRQRPQKGTPSPPPPPRTGHGGGAIVAKGFEDPVIAKQCSVAASTLRGCVEWVERVWGDTMP